ncbi:MAG TPA: response regulator, partial [Chthonomonadales bacterium]|nr:response regulator [Chthonomonadales bacterium]
MVERSIAPWVLVADAEPYICRVFEAKLTKNNSFRVICATTGAEALRAAAAISFDALLWDLRLRDTHNSLARLRSFCPNAALILMSTDDLPGLSEEIDRLDVADVLVKPFSLDLLVSRLDLALEVGASTRSISMHLTRVGQAISVISPMGACRTRVMETYPDRIAVVGPPRVEAPSDFAPGTRVKVELDGADALYSFHSRLVPESASMVPGWQLRLPRILRREQR